MCNCAAIQACRGRLYLLAKERTKLCEGSLDAAKGYRKRKHQVLKAQLEATFLMVFLGTMHQDLLHHPEAYTVHLFARIMENPRC